MKKFISLFIVVILLLAFAIGQCNNTTEEYGIVTPNKQLREIAKKLGTKKPAYLKIEQLRQTALGCEKM